MRRHSEGAGSARPSTKKEKKKKKFRGGEGKKEDVQHRITATPMTAPLCAQKTGSTGMTEAGRPCGEGGGGICTAAPAHFQVTVQNKRSAKTRRSTLHCHQWSRSPEICGCATLQSAGMSVVHVKGEEIDVGPMPCRARIRARHLSSLLFPTAGPDRRGHYVGWGPKMLRSLTHEAGGCGVACVSCRSAP